MKTRIVLGLILFISLIAFAQAQVNFDNYSIQKIYAKGSTLTGTINVSFANEPITSLFKDLLLNEVELREVLKDSDYVHTCSYPACGSFYEPTMPETTKVLTLGANETKVIGFSFTGDVQNIDSIKFGFSSDADESETNQIKLDILDDGIVEMGNIVIGQGFDPFTNYGCFNGSESNIKEATFSETKPFCQRVTLDESPGLFLGGWFKKTTAGTNPITMKLYSKTGAPLTFCEINSDDVSLNGGEIFCPVEYFIPKKDDFYVCAQKKFGAAEYKLKGYASSTNACGFMDFPPKLEITSYKIGAKKRNFGVTGTINVGDTLPNKENISDMVAIFILDRYEGDCSQGCHIPITLTSSVNQQLTFENLAVNYDEPGLLGQTLSEFSLFTSTPSLVNSNYQNLDISGFFNLPNEEIELNYKLFLGTKKLFEQDLEIKDYNLIVSPLDSIVSYPTTFNVTLPENITAPSYTWNFGDNTTNQDTVVPSISHSYQEKGNFLLTVTAHTLIGNFSKINQVTVGTAQELVNLTISSRKLALEEIKNQLIGFSPFEISQLKRYFDIDDLKVKLNTIEKSITGNVSDSKYTEALLSLNQMTFPKDIQKNSVGKTILAYTSKDISLASVSEVAGKQYSDSKNFYDSALYWDKTNVVSQLSQGSLLISWENGQKNSVKIYEVLITPNEGGITEDYYLFVKDDPTIYFEENLLGQKLSTGYIAIKMGQNPTSVKFVMDNSLSVLPFVSPSSLGNEIPVIEPVEKNPYGFWIFVIGLLIVFLIGVFIYLILYAWYKNKYEKFLFPNKNELFNAMTYVNNSIKNNVEESVVRKNLVKSGWKREQVNYLLRKYAGKNTGMPNLSLMKENVDQMKLPEIKEDNLPSHGNNFIKEAKPYLNKDGDNKGFFGK